jgi:hypothetical protein
MDKPAPADDLHHPADDLDPDEYHQHDDVDHLLVLAYPLQYAIHSSSVLRTFL